MELWFTQVNELMIRQHYHSVDPSQSLVSRLYASELSPSEAVDILHAQWVIDANLFAASLLSDIRLGITPNAWHRYLANHPYRKESYHADT